MLALHPAPPISRCGHAEAVLEQQQDHTTQLEDIKQQTTPDSAAQVGQKAHNACVPSQL